MATVYLNGDFVPVEQAHISVLDRGFLFADSIYEVIPVYHGRCFAFQEHLDRLARSCHAIKLSLELPPTQWQALCDELIARNEPTAAHHKIYIQITRGSVSSFHDRRLDYPPNITPTLVMHCIPLTWQNIEVIQPYHVITHEDIRRKDCHIKSNSLLANCLIQQTVSEMGADEAILIRDGLVTEGNSSNVFTVKNRTLITPPLGPHLLGGITRQLVIDIAKAQQIPVLEIQIPKAELESADEIWITSSTREIVPVKQLNQTMLNFNAETSLWKQMIGHYRNAIERFINQKH